MWPDGKIIVANEIPTIGCTIKTNDYLGILSPHQAGQEWQLKKINQ